ncbi:hypothetical protein [Streptomyces sp. RFCAC02]|uniref:hypothetical protein n=1 Tax=Streptomyces sp. RFCAC02 TaxID=2499143 RepID=UPI001020637A|nr:hypothetical protein [Streptomyces sp. RFCAC02]
MKAATALTIAGTLGAAALIGVATASSAYALDPLKSVSSGHVDLTEVECELDGGDALLEVGTHIDGNSPSEHVAPGNTDGVDDIGDYAFVHTIGEAGLTYSAGAYVVSDSSIVEEGLPFVGFSYDEEGACVGAENAPSVEIDVRAASGANPGDVTVATSGSGATSTADSGRIALSPGSHQHAVWTFEGPATGGSYALSFDVYADGVLLDTITPRAFVIE